MSAGYLGVDIFFVLSGFLITSGLLRSAIKTGSIDLLGFYHRRAKRLLPAALLVILAVLAWTAFAEPEFRRGTIATDAWYTVFYLANWRLISSSSYFESDGTTSPLLHMWSLAVEEQFYLVWPLLLIAMLWVLGGRLKNSRNVAMAVGGAAAVGAVISILLLAIVFDPAAPDRAYMGTDTKVFEPLIGAVLAVALHHPTFRILLSRRSRAVFWAGGLTMVALFAVLDGPDPFYFRGGAALFSIACAGVIGALATKPQTWEARLLAWAPMSYLGRISYGLYLWHWPIALRFGAHTGAFTPWRALAVVALTVALAAASYHWVEMPIRRGAIGRLLPPKRTIVAGLAAMSLVAGGASVVGATPLRTLFVPTATHRWLTPEWY